MYDFILYHELNCIIKFRRRDNEKVNGDNYRSFTWTY